MQACCSGAFCCPALIVASGKSSLAHGLVTHLFRHHRKPARSSAQYVRRARRVWLLGLLGLRAVLMTAVEEDKLIAWIPCRIKSVDNEHTPEPPVLTVRQVFELADRTVDRRFKALVLLAHLHEHALGEAIALRRDSIDLDARTVKVREQLIELDGGDMVLAPPKSRAGKRTVSIPSAIVPALVDHLDQFTGTDDDAFVFLGKRGAYLRGGNFRREAKWAEALKEMGVEGLHFHDLRHTGNTLAAQSGASLADLKARMGHDSDRAALIYQHATRDADRKIADALSARVEAERDARKS